MSETMGVVFQARTAHKLRVSAHVTDAEMTLFVESRTEVLAEHADEPDHFKIMWPYGVASATAIVHRNSLFFT